MRTLAILTLVAISFLLVSCDNEKIPQFPEIKKHYAVLMPGKKLPELFIKSVVNPQEVPTPVEVECAEYDIVSKHPYQLKFVRIAPTGECSGVGGYKPDDMVLFLNWVDDVMDIATKNRNCFK